MMASERKRKAAEAGLNSLNIDNNDESSFGGEQSSESKSRSAKKQHLVIKREAIHDSNEAGSSTSKSLVADGYYYGGSGAIATVAVDVEAVRVYCDGVWDLFHFGHARALQQAKNLFPRVHLIAGICNDDTTHKLKGKTVLNQEERAEMLRHCRYVDEVIEDAPWAVTPEFLQKHKIDWVVGSDENSDDGYKNVRELGRFIPIERTEGISTSHIIMRIVRDYDEFVKFNLNKGYSGKDMNVGLFKEKSLLVESKIQQFKEKVKENLKQKVDLMKEDVKEDLGRIRKWWTEQHLAVDFLKKFGEKKWFEKRSLMLGVLKVMAIVRQGDKRAKKAILPVDEEFRLELYLLCCQHVPGWRSIPSHEFHCAPLTGGLTNQLFKCWITPDGALHPTSPLSTFPTSPIYNSSTPPSAVSSPSNAIVTTTSSPQSPDHSGSPTSTTVLVRLFGEHSFFDRDKENTIFTIFSDLGFGPKLHGIFSKGRIEEFIFARTLLPEDLPKPLLSGLIAKKLAVMHSFDMPFPPIPSLFESLSNWLQAARRVSFPNDFIKDRIVREMRLDTLDEELEKLQIMLESLNSPVVFCHNDLQEGNIMWDQANESIRFIDFEYGNYNYRGFDIANHFCEWMFDYSKQEYPFFTTEPDRYPTEAQMRHFLRNYLTVVKTSHTGQTQSNTVEIPITDVDEREVDVLLMEARCFTLASHLLWAMWGIIQAKSSEIEFGFLEYSAARFREYYRLSAVLYPNIS